jgi:hypothetical protein
MKWHDPAAWPGGKVPGDSDKWRCGKAFSFFRRPDKTLVGICKMGFVTTSTDNGESWAQPLVPQTLITGKAKVWSQRTADGRYVLVYNPSRGNRYPLIAVTGDDGVHFSNMRLIHGELPIQRYEGRFRSIGPQYTRGISTWADDHSRDDGAMWLVYSMSKEDIWVSRVPLPIKPDAAGDHEPWNRYCPKWASLKTTDDSVEIENRDPYDYARAVRMLPPRLRIKASFELVPMQSDRGALQIELMGGFGAARPVRIALTSKGRIIVHDSIDAATYSAGQQLRFDIDADASRALASIMINGEAVVAGVPFAEICDSIHRLSFHSGEHRAIGGSHPVARGTDRPTQPSRYRISQICIKGDS